MAMESLYDAPLAPPADRRMALQNCREGRHTWTPWHWTNHYGGWSTGYRRCSVCKLEEKSGG